MATPAMKQVSALDVGRHMQVFQVTAANLNLDNSDATAVANLVKLVETAATFGNLVYIAIVSAKVVKIGYEYVAVVPSAAALDAALEAAFGTTAEFTTVVSA